MTDATVPVAPPAPLAVPVEPPAPTAPPLPPASPPAGPVVPPAAAVPPVPVAAGVGVVEAGTNTSATVAMQVTALPPPFEVPLHWLMVTGSAESVPVTVQPAVGSPA